MERFEIVRSLIAGGPLHLVKLKGKLDRFSFIELKAFFQNLAAEEKNARIVVDMTETSYVGSTGWYVLLAYTRVFRLCMGHLVVCGMNEEILRVYHSMKIEPLLPSAASVDGAVKLAEA